MNKLTYIEARDKIWNAYFRDEIKPLEREYCFCGTLCDQTDSWHFSTSKRVHKDFGTYLGHQYVKMERALLDNMKAPGGGYVKDYESNYEDKLFSGMLAALEVLKNIHRKRGDFIPEDEPLLTKRILAEEKRGVR